MPRKFRAARLTAGVLALTAHSALAAPGPFPSRDSHVWPVSGTTTPNLPFSSTFGPRLKASESFRYDWHRGVDMPVDCDTPLYAIRTGVVRMAGDYPGTYGDRMVQICHPKPGAPANVCGEDGDNDGFMDDIDNDGRTDGAVSADAYYSVYLHLAQAQVQVGEVVTAGQQVATSGDSSIGYSGTCQPGDASGGFDHLHFEIRDGGVNQMHAVHPLLVLPHDNPGAPGITIHQVDLGNPLAPVLVVDVTTPTPDTDFNRVEVDVYDTRLHPAVLVDSHVFDIQEWTLKYSPDVATLDTEPAYDGIYDDVPVFGTDAGITVAPDAFSTSSSQYGLRLTFDGLTGGPQADRLRFVVRAYDIDGEESIATFGPLANGSVTGVPGPAGWTLALLAGALMLSGCLRSHRPRQACSRQRKPG